MSLRVRFDRQKVAELCRRYGVAELALFGSVLRDDFRADSDVDVLVSFEPEVHPSLLELVELREDLKDLFGREVDLVERAGLRNPFRRRAILSTAEVVYAS
ncbi:MAG: nucleotidyltransferase family protein [candidate division WOR-3 bacterium]|nr:MAG: nucleotidyltransferase family protein [candidate division WOR-3 bacterium]